MASCLTSILPRQTAPGIGLISGRILANEIEDMKQFQNEKQLFSFTGLTPEEHSLGRTYTAWSYNSPR